jgi:hypothetical protein
VAVGLQRGEVTSVNLEEAATKKKKIDLRLLKVAEMLSI